MLQYHGDQAVFKSLFLLGFDYSGNFYNIGKHNTAAIYCHSPTIIIVVLFYKTEQWYFCGQTVNLRQLNVL
jgi:hypothetical protein